MIAESIAPAVWVFSGFFVGILAAVAVILVQGAARPSHRGVISAKNDPGARPADQSAALEPSRNVKVLQAKVEALSARICDHCATGEPVSNDGYHHTDDPPRVRCSADFVTRIVLKEAGLL